MGNGERLGEGGGTLSVLRGVDVESLPGDEGALMRVRSSIRCSLRSWITSGRSGRVVLPEPAAPLPVLSAGAPSTEPALEPLPVEFVPGTIANLGEVLAGYDKVVVPEMNLGQLASVIRAKYLVDAVPFNQISGLPFTAATLESMLEDVVKNG